MNLEALRKRLDRHTADRDHARRQLIDESKHLKAALARGGDLTRARVLVQAVAAEVQHAAYGRVAEVATRCLKAVFGPDSYELRVVPVSRRGKAEADVVLVKGGVTVDDPLGAAGGGVVDVAAFALRLACLVLGRPRRRQLLVLDEPFKHVSRDYRDNVRAVLESLAAEMGVQIITVTHSPELACGEVVKL